MYIKTLFFTGLLIAATPFLGLPVFWENILTAFLGLWVSGIATLAFIKYLSEGDRHSRKLEQKSPDETAHGEAKKLSVKQERDA